MFTIQVWGLHMFISIMTFHPVFINSISLTVYWYLSCIMLSYNEGDRFIGLECLICTVSFTHVSDPLKGKLYLWVSKGVSSTAALSDTLHVHLTSFTVTAALRFSFPKCPCCRGANTFAVTMTKHDDVRMRMTKLNPWRTWTILWKAIQPVRELFVLAVQCVLPNYWSHIQGHLWNRVQGCQGFNRRENIFAFLSKAIFSKETPWQQTFFHMRRMLQTWWEGHNQLIISWLGLIHIVHRLHIVLPEYN